MTQNNEDEDPKANADVPPVLPNEQQPSSTSRSRGALSPDDLDFTDSPYVDEIDDGRYVVSADRRPSSGSPAQQTRSAASGHQESNANATAGETAAESAATPRARDSTETAEQTPEEPSQSQPAAADSSEELQTPTREPAPSQSPQSVHETQATSQSPEAARSLLASELEHAEARYAIDIISRFDDETARHRTASDDVVGTFNSLLFCTPDTCPGRLQRTAQRRCCSRNLILHPHSRHSRSNRRCEPTDLRNRAVSASYSRPSSRSVRLLFSRVRPLRR